MDAGLPEPFVAESVELFRALLRIDTSNPPGRERAAAELLADSLREDGIEPRILEAAPQRANLLARLKGTGARAPLLLTAHLDVVPADAARWRHPPFGAVEDGGWIWGRGAVDMKNMAAMSAMVLKALRREGVPLARDVILAAVADEEAGCTYGSKFLVDEHPEAVRAEYALGELGGFTQELSGRRLYPIQVAQKGTAWIRARVEGTPGHGSIPREDNPVLVLSEALAKLTPSALPLHPSEPARRFIRAMARAQPLLARVVLPLILRPAIADRLLARLPDRSVGRVLNAILRNTATPTVLRAGEKTNVIPAWAEAEIDGRLAPGQRVEDLLRELRAAIGPRVRLDVMHALEPVEAPPDSPMFAHLERAVREMDPQGIAVPYLIPGFTDAAPFSRLGVRYYGFAPIWFPPSPGVSFSELYHGNDERIPVEGFRRGLVALYRAVRAWCSTG
ncbi:MAG TPA: M20/M25/M40 family metallo-hydrolase [Myxococcaceae bacterium]|nr:M20/M25/M40 family metallo-hydrolase [Myxococcaceae bacterium]